VGQTREYLEAFRAQAKSLLPDWVIEKIHMSARPSSGGTAAYNQRHLDKADAEDLLDQLAAILGVPDPDEPAELPSDDGDTTPRMTPSEAGDLELRALWRHYQATHFPPSRTPDFPTGMVPNIQEPDLDDVLRPGLELAPEIDPDAILAPFGDMTSDGYEPAPAVPDLVPTPGLDYTLAPATAQPDAETDDHISSTRLQFKRDVQLWIEKDAAVADEQRLVYGVVLIPELADSQGDIVSAEEIEQTAHRFLVSYRQQGIQHVGEPIPSIEVVESYIAPVQMEIAGRMVPQGSWVMVSKINDPEIWQMVKDGLLAGFSIQGTAYSHPEDA